MGRGMEKSIGVSQSHWLHAGIILLMLLLFLAGCSAVRQDLFSETTDTGLKPAVTLRPAQLVEESPAKTKGGIVGPELNSANSTATKAAARSSHVVLNGEPTPPNPEDVNQIGDRLITALESGAPVPANQAESPQVIDPWAPLPENGTTAPAPSLPERKSSEVTGSPVAEFSADRPWTNEGIPSTSTTIESRPLPEEWNPEVSETEMVPVDEPAVQEAGEGSYRLGPGDGIDVTVWEMPELSRALVVRPDGFISFPLIREINAAGKTPSQLEDALEQSLKEHLIEPEVNVVVTSVGSKSYYVFGAVANPGVYPHFRNTTLLQSIVTAGGFPSVFRAGQPVPHGDLGRIRIIRTTDRGREIITKNLKGLKDQEVLTEDIAVQPEDIIYIPQEAKLVYVFGEVLVPGVVPITDDTRILEAILGAGGVRPTAKRDQILLIRPNTGVPLYSCVSMKEIERGSLAANLPVQSGDIIFVPQKFIAKVAEFVQLYASAIQPALETYLTTWDAWFVHERFSSLRKNNWGLTNTSTAQNNVIPNPDP